MQWETVAIPFAAGIKPVSHGRVLDQQRLLTAQNCFFYQDEGPQKRYGHTSRQARTTDAPVGLNGIVPPGAPGVRENFSAEDPNLSEYWLLGWGLFNPDSPVITAAAQPQLGHLFGGWTRDSEVVAWDGFRAVSRPENDALTFGEVSGTAVMPALRAEPIAKSLNGQVAPDAADNGVVRTVAWVYNGDAYYSVYDSITGACRVAETQIDLTGAYGVRVIALGPWTHIICGQTNEITMRSFHQDTPASLTTRSLGATTVATFDARKVSESRAVLARIDTNQIKITVLSSTGTIEATYDPDQDGTTAATVSITPNHDNIGIIWHAASFEVKFREFSLLSGVAVGSVVAVATTSANKRLTIADNYLLSGSNHRYRVFVEDEVSTHPRVTALSISGSTVTTVATRHQAVLASQAFRVGENTYVWCLPAPGKYQLQATWVLCDENLLTVGKHAFGLALQYDHLMMPAPNWYVTGSSHPSKDVVVFSGAQGYRQRANVEAAVGEPAGVWTEPSILFYQLDFLPRVRHAQAGRSTYITGAQLWEYDGVSINEAGFHFAPEGTSVATTAGTGLDATKVYRWRVDLCYKNAQNEEIRSFSIAEAVYNGGGAGTTAVNLTIPHVPFTRREKAYFLVYRTEGDGTEYYLVSSRDPSVTGTNGFVSNSRGSATYTFKDDLSDTDLIEREYHPANAVGYLQPLPAPACEIIASGRDRLWLAGGELSPGEIAPSRYFQPGETPSFSPALNIQIDRNSEPITAIGFVGEVAAFFRKTSTYILESDGPNNVNQGVWGFSRLALADVGAVSHDTLALAGEGLYFQSPAGIRVITPGGGLRPPGAGLIGGLGTDVDTIATGDYIAVVVPKHSQIRWYSRNEDEPTLVVDYTKNVWTTWTGLQCVGAVYWEAGDTVVLLKGDGDIWTEKEGRYYDGDKTYEMVVKTAWLHAANMGDFQRIRRWALFGDADTGLNLRYRLFYDERPFHGEEGEIAFNGDKNTSTWGDTTWGAGTWGDSGNSVGQSGLWFRDNVFRFRKRAARQKCSVFSIELSDQGSNANFAPTVLALELGRKPGLDRIP